MKESRLTTIFFAIWIIFGCTTTLAQNVIFDVEEIFQGVDKVTIDGRFCNVLVLEGNQDVEFRGKIEGKKNADITIEYKQSGSELDIWVSKPNKNWYSSLKGEIQIKLPKNTSIKVDNSSGNIRAEGIADAYCNLETSSGNIEAREISSENLRVEASSGNIILYDIKANIRAEASSGNVSFENINGNVKAETSSGTVKLNTITGNIEAETSSGDIRLDDVNGALELESSSGDMTGNDIQITANSEFRTSSGDIQMDFQNDFEDFTFDLNASSGDLKIGEERAEKKFYYKQGDILIRGVSSSGEQEYN